MKKRKFYLYNPETDNFERFYPSIKDRMGTILSVIVLSLLLAVGFYFIIYSIFETPTVENLTEENKELKQKLKNQYTQIDNRLSNSLKVMEAIQKRDSNLYRVLLQMDPLREDLLNPLIIDLSKNEKVNNIGDNELVSSLYKRIDTLERNMLHQALSFNQLKDYGFNMRDQLDHTPAVLPINIKDFTVSSGYGTRIDPVLDIPKFHAGLDMPAAIGTEVYATADGKVAYAGDKNGYGNCVDIDHGYNYLTRYGHLSKILVKAGQNVKRGELIGLIGSSGKSTGPHLHYEVRFKEEPQNPVEYFFLDIKPEEYEGMVRRANTAGHVMD